jgi:hypothetical protein
MVCVKSDDGSHVEIDGTEIAAMPGLHPPQEGCGERQLEAGNHPVRARFFENGGDAYFTMTYRGPDTDNKVQPLPSSTLPECSSPSDLCPCGEGWCTKWYYNPMGAQDMLRLPETDKLIPQTVRVLSTVSFKNVADLANFLDKNGKYENLAAMFTGILSITKQGKYTFCTNSDDGSHFFVDGDEVVDNGGRHAPKKQCGDVDLETGDHRLRANYFENGGGATISLLYSGPDTGGNEVLVPSAWHSEDTCGRNPKAGPEVCDCTGGRDKEPPGECKDFKSQGYKKCNHKPGCKSHTACG